MSNVCIVIKEVKFKDKSIDPLQNNDKNHFMKIYDMNMYI